MPIFMPYTERNIKTFKEKQEIKENWNFEKSP